MYFKNTFTFTVGYSIVINSYLKAEILKCDQIKKKIYMEHLILNNTENIKFVYKNQYIFINVLHNRTHKNTGREFHCY